MSSSGSSGGGLLAWLRGLFGSDDSGGSIGTLEGNIGDDGSDEGIAGGEDDGNYDSPSDDPGRDSDRFNGGGGGGGGGGNEGGGSISLPSFSDFAPSWVTDLRALATASVAAGGTEIALAEDPIAFVRAVVSSSLIEAVQIIVGTIASGFLRILFIFVDAFSSAGSSVLGSFGSVGDVLLLLIDSLNNTIATLAAAAGPLSPIVVVIIYGGIVVVVAGAVRTALVATGFAP
jgi:hypothetical protein